MPVDKDDVGIGWTVQQETPLPEVESVPGQEFHVSQLPDPERQALELGANYPELWSNLGGTLPVHESRTEVEARPGGPEPGDLDKAEAFRKPVEASRAEGADNNQPEGVGNEFSVAGAPSPADDKKEAEKKAPAKK